MPSLAKFERKWSRIRLCGGPASGHYIDPPDDDGGCWSELGIVVVRKPSTGELACYRRDAIASALLRPAANYVRTLTAEGDE